MTDSEPEKPTSALLYCRVSKDVSGVARSTLEQEAELIDFCDRINLPVAEVITDNDVGASRYSRGVRKGFLQLKEKLEVPGRALVTWESSRLTRRLVEFAELRDFCADIGVHWYVGGRMYDLNDPQDAYMLTLSVQNAELEAAMTRKRTTRNSRARANAGRPHSRLPYGYRRVIDEKTGKTVDWVIDEVEAAVVREIVDQVFAGQTIYHIAMDLNARGIPAPCLPNKRRKGPREPGWVTKRIPLMLRSPSYAGLRTYRGTVLGPGTWEPILTEDEHTRLCAVLDARALALPANRGSVAAHLLTGIAVCDECDTPMGHTANRKTQMFRYSCPKYHVSRQETKVDDYVEGVMIRFLEDPRTIERLHAADETGVAGEAFALERKLRQQLDAELTAIVKADLTPDLRARAMERMQAELLPRIEAAKKKARQGVRDPLLIDLAGPNAADRWEALTLAQQRAAIRLALTVRIRRQPPMGARWDPSYVRVEWRD